MSSPDKRTIDLDEIFAKKFPNKKFPRWFVSSMKKFIHQDFINGFLEQGYEGTEFCTKCLEYLDVKVEVEGLENLDKVPEDTLLTFASNHPLGGVDGIALMGIIGERYDGRLKVPVNDFLMSIKGLSPFFIPVNKTGSQNQAIINQISQTYESNDQVLIFPAGVCSRKIKGKIVERPWTKSFITSSKKTGRSIVPVHFIGRNSNRFYNVLNLCLWLKTKFAFSMLFLPDELYRAQHKTFKVKFGEPIPPSHFDSSKTPSAWAQWLKDIVETL